MVMDWAWVHSLFDICKDIVPGSEDAEIREGEHSVDPGHEDEKERRMEERDGWMGSCSFLVFIVSSVYLD